jgi:hypothetical protein
MLKLGMELAKDQRFSLAKSFMLHLIFSGKVHSDYPKIAARISVELADAFLSELSKSNSGEGAGA